MIRTGPEGVDLRFLVCSTPNTGSTQEDQGGVLPAVKDESTAVVSPLLPSSTSNVTENGQSHQGVVRLDCLLQYYEAFERCLRLLQVLSQQTHTEFDMRETELKEREQRVAHIELHERWSKNLQMWHNNLAEREKRLLQRHEDLEKFSTQRLQECFYQVSTWDREVLSSLRPTNP